MREAYPDPYQGQSGATTCLYEILQFQSLFWHRGHRRSRRLKRQAMHYVRFLTTGPLDQEMACPGRIDDPFSPALHIQILYAP